MFGRTGRFRRTDRILRSRDFQRVGRTGKRLVSKYFVVLWAASEAASPGFEQRFEQRLGVTVSRRVGKAVVRNRVKRGIREWFRQQRGEFSVPAEIVVIARPPTAKLSCLEITSELTALLTPRVSG